jgi:hypothetical protein
MKTIIIPILKEDKNNPSNYRTIVISPILAKLCRIILEKKIDIWIEIHGKRVKGHAGFKIYHSIVYHLDTLRIIM